jgi:hypothetical protein
MNSEALSPMLIFWASSGFLTVDRTPDPLLGPESALGQFNVRIDLQSNPIFYGVLLDKKWRAAQPDKLEFIVIAFKPRGHHPRRHDPTLCLLLIETIGSISHRITVPSNGKIYEEQWMSANPQRKLIILA